MRATKSKATQSGHALPLRFTLLLGAAGLLASCGGSSGGGGSTATPTPIELPSTWSLSVEPQVVDVGDAIDIGLNGSEMVLEHLVTAIEDGVNYSVFSVAIEGIDLDSRAEPGESMLGLVVDDFNKALFPTGMYYWPEGDLTVSIDIWPGSQGDWNGTELSVIWRVKVYEGDVIEVAIDEAQEGQEEEPEPYNVIPNWSDTICVMTVEVTAVPTTASTPASLPVVYDGVLNGRSISLTYESASTTVAMYEIGESSPLLVGRFLANEEGEFFGAGAGCMVRGVVGETGATFVVRQLEQNSVRTSMCTAHRR